MQRVVGGGHVEAARAVELRIDVVSAAEGAGWIGRPLVEVAHHVEGALEGEAAGAIARGATAVMIGRPYAFALAVDGAEGVKRVIDILREELETTMALLGRASVRELDRGVLW